MSDFDETSDFESAVRNTLTDLVNDVENLKVYHRISAAERTPARAPMLPELARSLFEKSYQAAAMTSGALPDDMLLRAMAAHAWSAAAAFLDASQ